MSKEAALTLETALAGRRDALNPAELVLAAFSACMITGIERADVEGLVARVEIACTVCGGSCRART
jgi:hypothetical protein